MKSSPQKAPTHSKVPNPHFINGGTKTKGGKKVLSQNLSASSTQHPPTTISTSTPTSKKTPNKKNATQEMDLAQLSAYAVYNNLIPGVKSYEDTSKSTQASISKKSKKRRKAEVKKQEEEKNEAVAISRKSGAASAAAVAQAAAAALKSNSSKSNVPQANKLTPRRITPIVVPLNFSDRESAEVKGNKEDVKNAAEGGGESTPHKKKRRNRKKKADESKVANGMSNKSSLNEATSTEPPTKVRKIQKTKTIEPINLLPNPLATSNGSTGGVKRGGKMGGKQAREAEKVSLSLLNLDEKMKTANAAEAKKCKPPKSLASAKPNAVWESPELSDLNSLLDSKVVQDSVEHGKNLFAWMIYPESVSNFLDKHWEKQALLVKRGQLYPEYFDWILSSANLDDILRKNVVKYTKNIDVVYYDKGERVTVSEDMTHRVRPAAIWDYYATGNSIRLLNPQTYCNPLRRLNAALQEMFGTFVGANVYLTPPDAQGFAPHFDDIEAFVLQIEGRKHWKLYKPRNPHEVLPRYSSKDFGKEQETLGEPFMDVILHPGDLLYFPRGIIHQAKTVEGFHSMHITISCYQQNSWADLLKEHFSKAVDKLASTDVEFRKGLPMDYLSFMGLAPCKKSDASTLAKRKEFKITLKRLVKKVGDLEPDDAADQMGKKFIWDSLPPYLTTKEKDKTVVEDGEFLNNGIVKNRVEMDPDTKVKLIRKHCVRLISEESTHRLYYSVENPLVYHEDEPNFVEISEEFRSAVEFLVNSYPDYVRIEDLPMSDDDLTKKIQITADLWERGILMTERRLEAGEIDDEEFDFDDDTQSFTEGSESENEDDSDDMGMIEGDIDLDLDSEDDDDFDAEEMEMSDLSEADDLSVEEVPTSEMSEEDAVDTSPNITVEREYEEDDDDAEHGANDYIVEDSDDTESDDDDDRDD